MSKNSDRIIEILNNITNLRLQIKAYLRSNDKLTKQLNRSADEYIYSYLLALSGEYLWFLKKGKLPSFIKRTIKENNLDVPVFLRLKIYFNHIKYLLKQQIL